MAGVVDTVEARCADGIHGVPAAAWDALVAPGQGPLRHGFLEAWEKAELDSLRSQPLLVRGADGLVAAAHGYLYDLDMASVHSRLMASGLGVVRRLLPRALVARVLELGSPTPLVNPFLAPGPVPVERAAGAVLEAALDAARVASADMMIVQNFESAGSRRGVGDVLSRYGFEEVPIPPTVILELPFPTFDAYVGAMRAQYRRRLKKVMERSSHLEAEVVHDFADLAPELARLFRLVWDRADELKREILPVEFFRGVAALDYVSVLALRRRDGSLASYALLLDDEPWLHFLYTGFEQESGEREGAYFRLIYEIARHAIDAGFPCVNLGMTTLEPKLDAGGRPLALTAWIRHRHTRLQPLYVRLARGPFAPRHVPPRHVFKD